ncbi:MAG: hypothetical protein AAF660_03865 [Pseudomonadota bacterium]
MKAKRRCAAGDFQLVNTGQRIEDLFGDSVREVVLVVTHVHEWQHSYRRALLRARSVSAILDCRFRCGVDSGIVRASVVQQEDDGNSQHTDDHVIQALAGVSGDGLVTIDVALTLNAFRCQLVRPGENQRRYQPDGQDDEHQSGRPFRKLQDRNKGLRHLDQNPRRNDVGNADPENVSSF